MGRMKLRPSGRRLLRQIAILLFFAVCVEATFVVMARSGAFTAPARPKIAVRSSIIGIDGANEELLAQVGSGLVRETITWDDIEPSPKDYKTDPLKKIVDLSAKGIKVIVAVEARSSWATACPGDGPKEARSCSPTNPGEYDDLLANVAGQLKGKVYAYQIETELNNERGFVGSLDEYTNLLKQASGTIKKIDKKAKIATIGIEKDKNAVVEKFNSSIAQNFDILTIQNFGPIPETFAETKSIKQLVSGKEILAIVGGPDLAEEAVTERGQAGQIVAKTVGALAGGADKVLVYQAQAKKDGDPRQKTLGVKTFDGQPTIALTALEQLVRLTQGLKKTTILSKLPQVVKVSFADGNPELISVWTPQEGTINLANDLGEKVRVFNLDGDVKLVDAKSIDVGLEPVLVSGLRKVKN